MAAASEPETTLRALRARVEQSLDEITSGAAIASRLREAMRYSLLNPAKRLRPCLVLLASEACGGEPDRALPAACAVEFVHTYSLVHDDLPAMDDDEMRRGKPTNHRVFGEAMAILVGDALLTLAFETLSTRVEPAEVAAACCADLAMAAGWNGMVGGQVLDLAAEETETLSVEQLREIHRNKTGALITASLVIGGRIGGADESSLECLRNYGFSVGLAFQIADDLLDVEGDASKLGKAVRKDADRGKTTYPALLGIEESRAEAKRLAANARQAVAPLGERAANLAALADYIIERDR